MAAGDVSEKEGDVGEALLSAWVDASIAIINERIVALLTYKESLVCRELKRAGAVVGGSVAGLTATELCQTTRMVKSQMNHILTSLEEKHVVVRNRSEKDKRRIEVLLDASPDGLYQHQHDQLVAMVNRMASLMGTERAWETTQNMCELASVADWVLSERSDAPDPAPA